MMKTRTTDLAIENSSVVARKKKTRSNQPSSGAALQDSSSPAASEDRPPLAPEVGISDAATDAEPELPGLPDDASPQKQAEGDPYFGAEASSLQWFIRKV